MYTTHSSISAPQSTGASGYTPQPQPIPSISDYARNATLRPTTGADTSSIHPGSYVPAQPSLLSSSSGPAVVATAGPALKIRVERRNDSSLIRPPTDGQPGGAPGSAVPNQRWGRDGPDDGVAHHSARPTSGGGSDEPSMINPYHDASVPVPSSGAFGGDGIPDPASDSPDFARPTGHGASDAQQPGSGPIIRASYREGAAPVVYPTPQSSSARLTAQRREDLEARAGAEGSVAAYHDSSPCTQCGRGLALRPARVGREGLCAMCHGYGTCSHAGGCPYDGQPLCGFHTCSRCGRDKSRSSPHCTSCASSAASTPAAGAGGDAAGTAFFPSGDALVPPSAADSAPYQRPNPPQRASRRPYISDMTAPPQQPDGADDRPPTAQRSRSSSRGRDPTATEDAAAARAALRSRMRAPTSLDGAGAPYFTTVRAKREAAEAAAMFDGVKHWLLTVKEALRQQIPAVDILIKEVSEWVEANHARLLRTATAQTGAAIDIDDVWALGLYTYDLGTHTSNPSEENFFAAFNWFLRTYREPSEVETREAKRVMASWRPYMHYLLRALDKLPLYRGRVYRGIECVGKCPLELHGTYRFCAFTSTSQSESAAREFALEGGMLLEMVLAQIDGYIVGSLSYFGDDASGGEAEVLLPPGAMFAVSGVDDTRRPMRLELIGIPDSESIVNR